VGGEGWRLVERVEGSGGEAEGGIVEEEGVEGGLSLGGWGGLVGGVEGGVVAWAGSEGGQTPHRSSRELRNGLIKTINYIKGSFS